MSDKNFDPSNHVSLDDPKIVLRDSLGYLAVQILSKKEVFTKMSYSVMIHELEEIIRDLHSEYDSIQ